MTAIELIKKEMDFVSNWTLKHVKDIPEDQWDLTPPVLETNLNWLVGHLVVSKYFHGVLCIVGKGVFEHSVDSKKYVKLYSYTGIGALNLPADKPVKDELLGALKVMDGLVDDVLLRLNDNILNQPTEFPNPVATTKLDALTWCYKHQMWHVGQIATLKRVLKAQQAV